MYTNISVNSSSGQLSSSNVSVDLLWNTCSLHIHVFSAFFIVNVLLLPVPVLVIYLGYRKWRQRRSVPVAATISHTDYFTYHSVAMQLSGFLAFMIFFCGLCFNYSHIGFVGISFWMVTSVGQELVHLLTCVVHYLAVVHPVAYRGLKKTSGVRIRNVSIGCVWLSGFTYLFNSCAASTVNMIMEFSSLAFVLIVVSFCCISVLCTLKRPGPRDAVGDREQVDHVKQRALNTIMAIMGILWLRFLGILISEMIYYTLLSTFDACVLFMSTTWLSLPSCMVLPVLFLHRAEKLQCCKRTTESG